MKGGRVKEKEDRRGKDRSEGGGREEGEREREGGRKEGGNSSRRKPFSVHSLDPVLWKCEVPGPSDVVGREVADN